MVELVGVGRDCKQEKKVILENCCWKVGNSRRTKLWKDLWVPNINGFYVHPLFSDQVEEEQMLACFIGNENKAWKLNELKKVLPEEAVIAISAIHIPTDDKEDSIVCLFECDGQYLVRTGYK